MLLLLKRYGSEGSLNVHFVDDKTRAGTEEKNMQMQASEMLGWGDSQCVAEGVV